jgi:hypothetical protein
MMRKDTVTNQMLICFDNAEDLIEKESRELKILLDRLLNEVPHLKILLTMRPD